LPKWMIGISEELTPAGREGLRECVKPSVRPFPSAAHGH